MSAPSSRGDGDAPDDERPLTDEELARLAESTSEEEFTRDVQAEREARERRTRAGTGVDADLADRADDLAARSEAARAAMAERGSPPAALPLLVPAQAAVPDPKGRAWMLALLLAVLVFVAFRPAFGAEFVNWDDGKNFTENMNWRGLSSANVAWMFSSFHMAHWHPLTWLSLGAEYSMWGLDAARMHVVNIAIHAAAAIAALFFARALFKRIAGDASTLSIDLAAFFSAALFALHPLRVESVAWVTERRDVLSGLFFFLTLLAWISYTNATEPAARRRYWILSLVFFAAAAMSKEAVFVLPFLMLVLDLWPLRRARTVGMVKLVAEKLPHFAVTAALMIVAVRGQNVSAGTMYSLTDYPFDARCVQAGVATYFYPMKTVWPVKLLPMYELPPTAAMFSTAVMGRAILGVGVALVALLLFRVAPALACAWLCFLITVAPVSGLTQAGSQIAADRYSYLACVPFALLVGGALFLLARRSNASVLVGSIVGGALTIVLIVLTTRQTAIWHDSRALWSHTLEIDKTNKVALEKMGEVLMVEGAKEGPTPAGVEAVRRSIELVGQAYELDHDPNRLLNMSAVIRKLGDVEPAKFEEHVANALKVLDDGLAQAKARGPEKPMWHRTRGELLMDSGRLQDALAELRLYVTAEPENTEGQYLIGATLVELNQPQDGIPHLLFARSRTPDDVRIWASLADAFGRTKRFDEARAAWSRVIELRRGELGPAAEGDTYVGLAREMLKKLEGR